MIITSPLKITFGSPHLPSFQAKNPYKTFKKYFKPCVYVPVFVCVFVYGNEVLSEDIKRFRLHEARVTGGHESPKVGAGNWSQLLSRTVLALNFWGISLTPLRFHFNLCYLAYFLCVHICDHMWVGAGVRASVWKLKVDIGCLPWSLYREAEFINSLMSLANL